MKIVRAEKMGFCFGVKEAVNLAEELAEEKIKGNIYMLGMLVHNEFVINELEKKDIKILYEDDVINDRIVIGEEDIVIVRAHGTTEEIYKKLIEKKVMIHDAACIFVKRSRNQLADMEKNGYEIIFIGDENHPEVKGIVSFGRKVRIFEDMKALEDASLDKNGKYYVLAQTTLNKNMFLEIMNYFKEEFKNSVVGDTICGATYERQKAIEKLAKEVDLVLVVGGKNSSNTKKLYTLSKSININSYLIQDENDIKPEWLAGKEIIGITAGASTPEKIIFNIENKLRGK